ncbi:MAG: hypothetical protein QOF48_311 [Verrucomicrobiota bacterium]|jgi:hypothetical protein
MHSFPWLSFGSEVCLHRATDAIHSKIRSIKPFQQGDVVIRIASAHVNFNPLAEHFDWSKMKLVASNKCDFSNR